MREPDRKIQALRDGPPPAGAERKPVPPPPRVVEIGIFTYREVEPVASRKAG